MVGRSWSDRGTIKTESVINVGQQLDKSGPGQKIVIQKLDFDSS